jgi:hypothetical protein
LKNLTHKEADLSLAGLSIWVHGWQYPSIDEYWDANWLYCTARCIASGAHVEVTDSFLHVPELVSWLGQCESLHRTLSGQTALEPMEPTVRVVISTQSLGHMQVHVELTPDNLHQKHWFEYDADQSHIGQLVAQLRALLQKFPIRGSIEHAT